MADDRDLSADSKLTRSKRRWAEEGRFLTGRHARPEEERLPPGQHLVRDWPVLDLGRQPEIPLDRWSLRLFGLVEHPMRLDWTAFQALPLREATSTASPVGRVTIMTGSVLVRAICSTSSSRSPPRPR